MAASKVLLLFYLLETSGPLGRSLAPSLKVDEECEWVEKTAWNPRVDGGLGCRESAFVCAKLPTLSKDRCRDRLTAHKLPRSVSKLSVASVVVVIAQNERPTECLHSVRPKLTLSFRPQTRKHSPRLVDQSRHTALGSAKLSPTVRRWGKEGKMPWRSRRSERDPVSRKIEFTFRKSIPRNGEFLMRLACSFSFRSPLLFHR